jgi:uncharacterized protein (TIGR04255 family)
LKLKKIPNRIEPDAIIEALFEMRFEMESIPEVLFGRLVDNPTWKAWEQRRLPAYDLPAPIRQADENLRYQPVFELNDVAANSSIRIGSQVLSYHQRAPYGSWALFESRVGAAITQLFDKAQQIKVLRLGVRYINALERKAHGITGVNDLDLNVQVAGESFDESLNINLLLSPSPEMACMLRVATPDFVQGIYSPDTSVLVDVDVYTKQSFAGSTETAVKDWFVSAHQKAKEYFFALLTEKTIKELEKK